MIDTSGWVPFFRRKGDAEIKEKVGNILVNEDAVYCCPVHFELIVGASDHEIPKMETGLSFAERLNVTPQEWNLAAETGANLRRRGIILPIPDILIATISVSHELPLYANDKHFQTIKSEALPKLRLI